MIESHVSTIARRAVIHIHRNFGAMRSDGISATTRRSLDMTDFNLKRRFQVATTRAGIRRPTYAPARLAAKRFHIEQTLSRRSLTHVLIATPVDDLTTRAGPCLALGTA
jgi:hypothetical protein